MCADFVAKTSTGLNTYLKDVLKNPESIDQQTIDKFYGDILIDSKNLKHKIAEYVKKEPEIQLVDQYSSLIA